MDDKKELQTKNNSEKPKQKNDYSKSSVISPLQRFEKSMHITYEMWHDGAGYDMDALKSTSTTERKIIEQMLIHRSPRDWQISKRLQKSTQKAPEKPLKTR